MTSTFKLGSNFPAKASNRVVFPEDGGPSKRVILHTNSECYIIDLLQQYHVTCMTCLKKKKII